MDNKNKISNVNNNQKVDQLCQTGKTPKEMELYLTSGEPDDLSEHFTEQ